MSSALRLNRPFSRIPPLPFSSAARSARLASSSRTVFSRSGLAKADAGTATSICLIFLSALLTGLNLYNSIARFAGAGTLVPITGFANSVVSPCPSTLRVRASSPVWRQRCRRRGTGHRVRHARKRCVRRCSDAAVRKKRSAAALSFFAHVRAISGQGGKLTKFAFSLFHRVEEAEACPFMVYPRLFC